MKAFCVKAGTEVRMVPHETYAGGGFLAVTSDTLPEDEMFFLEDMIIDPTGIHKNASGPVGAGVGSAWARAGWYGFAFADPYRYPKGNPDEHDFYAILIPANAVAVN